MRTLLIFLAVLFFTSCVSRREITFHSDNTATVKQDYLESPLYPREQWDTDGPYDKTQERLKYRTSVISNFKDVNELSFRFKIEDVDSLTNYLSGLPKGFVKFTMVGDTLCEIETTRLESKPEKMGDVSSHYFYLNFERDVVSVEASPKSRLSWDDENLSRKVGLFIHPKRLWKRKRTHSIIIRLK